jgi:thiol-disulfide isomerase/thioredoxin
LAPLFKAYGKYTGEAEKAARDFYFKYRDSLSIQKYSTLLHQKTANTDLKGLEYIKENSNSFFSLWLFKHDYSPSQNLPAAKLLAYFQKNFPDSLKQTFEGKEILKQLHGRINTRIGGEAPDFKIKDMDGKVISLQDLKVKYVLLDFWASWCVPCRRLTPLLKTFRAHYSSQKLVMISLSIDNDRKNLEKAIAEDKPTWPQILVDNNLRNSYVIGSIPEILLLNPRGIVIYNREQENDYKMNKLEQLLERCIQLQK